MAIGPQTVARHVGLLDSCPGKCVCGSMAGGAQTFFAGVMGSCFLISGPKFFDLCEKFPSAGCNLLCLSGLGR